MTRFLSKASIAMLAALIAGHDAQAVNNPLNTIKADGFDGQNGGIKTEVCSEGGRDICSIHDGNNAVYKDFDFDSGVAGFKARIATSNSGSIEIRLDRPTGILLGACAFESTGGWQDWKDITCKVDNSQAGVRDVYLVFRGNSQKALVNVSSFVFLKSIPINPSQVLPGFPDRVDAADDELQAPTAWGMPQEGFVDNFEDGRLGNWNAKGITVTKNAIGEQFSAESPGTNFNFAFTPGVYINKTDTGGEWRTMAEASFAADIILDSANARPGIGFSSKDGKQWIYVALNAGGNSVEAWRKLSDGSMTRIKEYAAATNATSWSVRPGVKYRLQIDWSPYSDGLIVILQDDKDCIVSESSGIARWLDRQLNQEILAQLQFVSVHEVSHKYF